MPGGRRRYRAHKRIESFDSINESGTAKGLPSVSFIEDGSFYFTDKKERL